jgi:DNA-binding response OmpR family regulator
MTNKGVLLVVDDTHATLKLLTDILSAAGYQVRPADSGELALTSVAASPPDLILLDIRMPVMDGFEVLRRLMENEAHRDIPVIFLSAMTETEQRVSGLKSGAVDFISKPFQTEELLARVQTHMELRRLRGEIEDRAAELLLANNKLQEALANVKTLSGLLPICATCKKIRDDKGYWSGVETYISKNTKAVFTHGICPECAKNMYEELEKLKNGNA